MKYDTFLSHLNAPVRKDEGVEKAHVGLHAPAKDKALEYDIRDISSDEDSPGLAPSGPHVADEGEDALHRPYETTEPLGQYDVLYSPVIRFGRKPGSRN